MLKQKITSLAILSILFLLPLPLTILFAAPLAKDSNDPAFPQIVCVLGSMPTGIVEGTGFVVAPGYILTSYHGLEKTKALTVQFEKGSAYPAVIFSVSEELDLALLSFPYKKAPFLSFSGEERRIRIGAPI